MNRRVKLLLSVAALIVGLAMLLASAAWSKLFPPVPTWTAERHKRLVELSNEASDLSAKVKIAEAQPSMHAGENAAELLQRFRQADAEYKKLYREFKTATEPPPTTVPTFLRWSGIAFVVAGAIIVFANRA